MVFYGPCDLFSLAWLTSYLTNRSQTVRMGDVSSNPSKCFSGVPQGSVLGPILFSLHISPSGELFLILAWLISSMLTTPNFTSVSRGIMSLTPLFVQKPAWTISASGSVITVCALTLTNLNPYCLAHASACTHSLWLHPSKLKVRTSNFLIKSQVLVSSWTPLSPSMPTSRLFARHVTFILDLSDTLGAHYQLTWLSRLLLQWCTRG